MFVNMVSAIKKANGPWDGQLDLSSAYPRGLVADMVMIWRVREA